MRVSMCNCVGAHEYMGARGQPQVLLLKYLTPFQETGPLTSMAHLQGSVVGQQPQDLYTFLLPRPALQACTTLTS